MIGVKHKKKTASSEKIRLKARGQRGTFDKNRTLQVRILPNVGDKGKRRGKLPKFGQPTPLYVLIFPYLKRSVQLNPRNPGQRLPHSKEAGNANSLLEVQRPIARQAPSGICVKICPQNCLFSGKKAIYFQLLHGFRSGSARDRVKSQNPVIDGLQRIGIDGLAFERPRG